MAVMKGMWPLLKRCCKYTQTWFQAAWSRLPACFVMTAMMCLVGNVKIFKSSE